MFRDCPHKGEKVRIVHNVQRDEIVEDMGINVPRIYVSLDNNQVEYESHMIEVEGMINNQTIAILID
jgi:type III secretory pathway component EscV